MLLIKSSASWRALNIPRWSTDVRQFLETIEAELRKCANVLKYRSSRWRDFVLPLSINRDGIVSSGYRYGEFRFTLEQNRILDLLMGDSLYDDPYVFVRELLQNAIDTTRHRVFFESRRSGREYVPPPIQVSCWIDAEKYQWIRIDDHGMGMTEEVILKILPQGGGVLLQVGAIPGRAAHLRQEPPGLRPDQQVRHRRAVVLHAWRSRRAVHPPDGERNG